MRIDADYLAQINTDDYTQEWKVYLAAKHYIENKIYVLPIVPNGKGLPRKEQINGKLVQAINYGAASRNPKVIDNWFHPDSGRYVGYNIGIACGREGGVFAVDADVTPDCNGIGNYESNDLPDSPVQRTPRGGKHYLYLWAENATSSTSKIAKGVDTRGGDSNSCKSHIVAFPSIVNGKRYEWESGGEITAIPPFVYNSLGVPWKPPSHSNRGNEGMTNEDVERPIPLDQIRRMLDYIDQNEVTYDEWLRIGQAIHSQYPDDDGLEVWDSWSKNGSRYKKNECHIRWNGFKSDGPVRIGSLVYYAKKAGWSAGSDDVDHNSFDELVEELNQEFAVVLVGNKIRILVENSDRKSDDPRYSLLDRDSFRTWMEPRKVVIDTSKGPVLKPAADIWLASPARRTYHNGLGMFPDGKVPSGYYNTWEGFTTSPRPGDCSVFLSHVRDVLCKGNEDHYNWVMDWFADLIQDPANPKGASIILHGDEGAGKGMVFNTIGKLLGTHYVHLTDDEHLTGKFNAHMQDALLVFADEILWGGNKKTAGKLKGLVTERELMLERKGIDVTKHRNMIHLVVASNEDWFIPAGPQSRRWFVLDVANNKVNDHAYFDKFFDQMKGPGLSHLLHYLQNRKITHNLRRAPETEALEHQRERLALSEPFVHWVSRIIEQESLETPDEDNPDSKWPSRVNRLMLYEEFANWSRERVKGHVLGSTIFYAKLRELGFIDKRVKSGPRLFEVPPLWLLKSVVKTRLGINLEK